MTEYVENMKEYVENMQEYEENMKKYPLLYILLGLEKFQDPLSIKALGFVKIPSFPPI